MSLNSYSDGQHRHDVTFSVGATTTLDESHRHYVNGGTFSTDGHWHSLGLYTDTAGNHSHTASLTIPSTNRRVGVIAEDWLSLSAGTHTITVQVTGPAAAYYDGQQSLQAALFPAQADLAGTDGTLVTPAQTLAGLVVHREIFVPAHGEEDFARTVDVFTNPTESPLTSTVRILGNLGSDAATTVFATSDGDTEIETSDRWFGTDDADGTRTPAIVHYLHGPLGLQPASVSLSGDRGDNIEWTYQLTVPAGQTVRLAHFTILAATRAAALAAAQSLVTPAGFGGQAAAFLDAGELASVANFAFDATPPFVTVHGLITVDATPAIAGTVSDGTLQVTVNGKTYAAGDGNLSVSGTHWTLQIPAGDALPWGTYDVVATATDAAGNVGIDATTNELQIVKLIVTNLLPTPSGFAAGFSGEFQLPGLNLYDGVGGTLGLADVTLTHGRGRTVAGSMVIADNRQAIEFGLPNGVRANKLAAKIGCRKTLETDSFRSSPIIFLPVIRAPWRSSGNPDQVAPSNRNAPFPRGEHMPCLMTRVRRYP